MPNFFEEKTPTSHINLLEEAALAGDIEQVKTLIHINSNSDQLSILNPRSDSKPTDEKGISIKENLIFDEYRYNRLLEKIIIKMRNDSVKKQIYLDIIKTMITYGIEKNFNFSTYLAIFENAVLNLKHNATLDFKIDIELILALSQAGFYNFWILTKDASTDQLISGYNIIRKALDENLFNSVWEKITQDVILYHIIKNEKIDLMWVINLLEERFNFKLIYDALLRKLRFKEKDHVCKEFKAYRRESFSEQQRKNILKAALKHTALETLSVDREFIGKNIKTFIRYLAKNDTLTHLELDGFSDNDLKQIANGMHSNSSLQSLTIKDSGNNLKKYKIKNKSTPLPNILNSFKYLKSLDIRNAWSESKVNTEMPFLLASHNHLTEFSFYNLGECKKFQYRELPLLPDFKGIISSGYYGSYSFIENNEERPERYYRASVISNMIKFNQQLYALELRESLTPILIPDVLKITSKYYFDLLSKESISPDDINTCINPMIQLLHSLIPPHLHKFFEISIKRNFQAQYVEIRSPNLLLKILKNGIDSLNKNNKRSYIIIDKKNQNRAIIRSFKECYGNIEATESFKFNFLKEFTELASGIKRINIPPRTFTSHFFHKQVSPYISDSKEDELAAYQSRIRSKYI